MKDVRRPSTDSRVSVENALLNVAASQISTSMTKLSQDEVSAGINRNHVLAGNGAIIG